MRREDLFRQRGARAGHADDEHRSVGVMTPSRPVSEEAFRKNRLHALPKCFCRLVVVGLASEAIGEIEMAERLVKHFEIVAYLASRIVQRDFVLLRDDFACKLVFYFCQRTVVFAKFVDMGETYIARRTMG